MATSPDWLHYQAEVHPEREALVNGGRRWTFRALDHEVARLAGVLVQRGIRPGDRVAYRLPGEAGQVMLVHASTRIGAVLVPLNTRLTPAELAPIVANAQPTAIIHDDAAFGWPPFDGPLWSLADLMADHTPAPVRSATLDFGALHALVYTSGTTGVPKGVELTVGNQWWSAVGFGLNAGLQDTDRWLHVMPLFHVGGLTILFRSVIQGSTVVLEPRFDAVQTYDLLDRERITLLSVVPTMVHRLLELPGDAPPHLRLALLGGAPAARSLIDQAHHRGYPVVPTYGMTETCSQIVTLERSQWTARVGSSGHPNLPTVLRIMGENGPQEPGQPGEIWVHGPTVARGYWKNPEATIRTFHDGWLKTGDIGFLDADGYLTVSDRVKDIIIRGGENIYPSEVESVLVSHPAVADVAVFDLPDPEWGQRVAAAVVTRDPHLMLTDLRNFLSKRLASYKMPSIYYRVDAVPRNASGKVLRVRLRESAPQLMKWTETDDF